jgi:hypothetical protein
MQHPSIRLLAVLKWQHSQVGRLCGQLINCPPQLPQHCHLPCYTLAAGCGPSSEANGSTARWRIVGRPCGQLKGASSCASLASMRPCCWRVRGLPIMMEVRQARLASTSRTLHGSDSGSGRSKRRPGSSECCLKDSWSSNRS